jgi:hypothetical protein
MPENVSRASSGREPSRVVRYFGVRATQAAARWQRISGRF